MKKRSTSLCELRIEFETVVEIFLFLMNLVLRAVGSETHNDFLVFFVIMLLLFTNWVKLVDLDSTL